MKAASAMLKKFTNSKTVHDLGKCIWQLGRTVDPVGLDSRVQVTFDNKCFNECTMFLALGSGILCYCIEKGFTINNCNAGMCLMPYFLRSLPGNVRILDPFPGGINQVRITGWGSRNVWGSSKVVSYPLLFQWKLISMSSRCKACLVEVESI